MFVYLLYVYLNKLMFPNVIITTKLNFVSPFMTYFLIILPLMFL